jgi:putative hemin transport protein
MENSLTIDKPVSIASLAQAWEGLQKAKPGLRIREAAKELGSSEAQLLATKVGNNCTRLEGNWQDFLKRLPELGYVMSLTRNDSCILEHKGSFQKVNTFGNNDHAMGTVIGPIETRVFFKAWYVAFALEEKKEDRTLKSLQIFDHAGEAITKIFLQPKSNEEAYYKLIEDFKTRDQSPEVNVKPYESESFASTFDHASFLKDWDNLKDTHDFFPMLKKYQAHRYHALEVAAEKYTHQIDPKTSLKQILEESSVSKLPIMIFAGNRGNLQIHQGKVRTIRVLDHGHAGAQQQWLNVLEPEFNLHLRQDHVHTVWVVKKPTTDGIVTSVEAFDNDKNMIVQFFGLRKPGIEEKGEWAALVANLPKL